jgi:hypothetical protein
MNTHEPIIGRYVYIQCEGRTYRVYPSDDLQANGQ